MSGLAIGREPAEYLEGGTIEAKALLTLCDAISASTVVEVFAEAVCGLVDGERGAMKFQQRAPGVLSRVVLLEQRTGEKGVSDVDATQKRSMECALAATLCSVQAQSNVRTTAMLICLVRRFFLPRTLSDSCVGDLRGFADHERWLKDIVRGDDGAMVKALIKALIALVHLEPLQFLRTNHRVFSGNKLHLRTSGEYLLLVRARISDLDPLHKAETNVINANNLESQLPPLESRKKAEVDVTKFVTEFARSGGKIPVALVRQMNFHRYHFRAYTLPVLLNPNLMPSTEGANPLLMNEAMFDEQRINLIKVMAFKRKDRAITREEAQIAIEAMREAKRNSLHQKADEVQARLKPGLNESIPNESDNITQTVELILKRCLRKKNSVQSISEDASGKTADTSEKILSGLIDQLRENIAQSKEPIAIAELAAATLQGILDALLEGVCEVGNHSAEETYERYQHWWQGYGAVLQALFINVIGHENVRPLQKHLQCHLFALVCMQMQVLTPTAVICLAQLITVIAVLVGNSCLAELCFLPQSESASRHHLFVRAVFESLSLSDAMKVRGSVRFALHSVCLLKAAKREGSIFVERSENGKDIDYAPDTQSRPEDTLHRLFMKPLESLLRWVLSMPWRLLAVREGDENNLVDEDVTFDAENMLRITTHLLSSENFSISEVQSLRDWLETEYRCGWGRPKTVRKVLDSFCCSGMQASEIIGESCDFLASIASTQRNADWIWQGVLLYADESFCGRLKSVNKDVRIPSPLSQFLGSCVDRHGVEVGSCMLDLISSTSHWYFGDMQFEQADGHVAEKLIPWFWPLSCRCLKYLLRSLDKCITSPLSEVGNGISQAFLIANIVMQWDILSGDIQDWKFCSAHSQSLMTKVENTKKCIDVLIDTDAPSRERMSQLPESLNNLLTSACEQYPKTLGMTLVVCFTYRFVENRRNTVSHAKAFAGMISVLVCSVSAVTVVDVIDVMLYVSALIPFTHHFSEYDEYEAALQATRCTLPKLLEERMRLPGAAAPVWMREKQGDKMASEDDYRRIVLQWLGQATIGIEDTRYNHLESSLAVCVCMGRILTTIKDISNDTLTVFLTGVDGLGVASGLVPNILNVYATLTQKPTEFATEKLSLKAFERLLMCRASLSNGLLKSLSHVVFLLQSAKLDSIEQHVHRLLSKFPQLAGEFTSHLRYQN